MTLKSLLVPIVNLIRQNQTPKTAPPPFRSAFNFFWGGRKGVSSLVGPIITRGAIMWGWGCGRGGGEKVNEGVRENKHEPYH